MSAPASRIRFPYGLLWFYVTRIFPGWLFLGVFILLFQIAVCGIVHDNDNVKAMLQFLKIMPPLVRNMFGGQYLTPGNTPALIAIGYQHPLVLILYMVFAVGTPTSLLVGEVQRGTMELILSRPVTRTQAFVCAAIPTVGGMFLLAIMMLLGTVAGTSVYHFDHPVPLDGFVRLAVNGAIMASTVGSIAMFIASCCRERGTAVGLTVAYLVVDYFLNLISNWWPRMHFLRPWALFHYVKGPRIFAEPTWPLADMSVLIGVAAAALIAGWLVWRRRDLPT